MPRAPDPLRVTLDELALPAGVQVDRPYLVSLLRRLGYSEQEIERKLGPAESRTIEVEYSGGDAPEFDFVAPTSDAAAAPPVAPPPTPEPEGPGETSFVVRDPYENLPDFSPTGEEGMVSFIPKGGRGEYGRGRVETGEFEYSIGYKLYYRDVKLPSGRTQRIYFFSRTKPRVGVPCDLPPGYDVCENTETGLPFLAKEGECPPGSKLIRSAVPGAVAPPLQFEELGWQMVDEPDEDSFAPVDIEPPAEELPEDLSSWEVADEPEEVEEAEDVVVTRDDGAFTHGDYTLYRREVEGAEGDRPVYFFAKEAPAQGQPCPLPDGHEVRVNSRTQVPYLVRVADAAAPAPQPSRSGRRVRIKVVRGESREQVEEMMRREGKDVLNAAPIDIEEEEDRGEQA